VTHDQEEALEISDLLVLLNKGKVEQLGSPREVYEKPASPFVMSFIGPVNELRANGAGGQEGATTLVRPSDITVIKGANGQADQGLGGRVEQVRYLGATIKLQIALPDGQSVQVHLSRDRFAELELEPGDWVSLEPKQPRVFQEDYSI
jgi:sulfate transport system ATP-binding protein